MILNMFGGREKVFSYNEVLTLLAIYSILLLIVCPKIVVHTIVLVLELICVLIDGVSSVLNCFRKIRYGEHPEVMEQLILGPLPPDPGRWVIEEMPEWVHEFEETERDSGYETNSES